MEAATVRTEVPSAGGAVAAGERPDPHVLVLFGAAGDLAARKLLPGLFHLCNAGLMAEEFRIVGTAGQDMDTDAFREHAAAKIEEFGRTGLAEGDFEAFAERLSYVPVGAGAGALGEAVASARRELPDDHRLLHYLAVPPAAFDDVAGTLGELGLCGPEARVITEKPFGHDHDSAVTLNELLHSYFEESQIFRIDHYLGKEAVQNVLALRFANGLYEPIWNRNNIDYVQIDVPETLEVSTRAGFYEDTGAYRDVVVTHMLQVLSFIAMEPPASLAAEHLVAEKTKVFEAMRPIDLAHVVRGQYEGYREIEGVAEDSDTETFVALRVEIDNWRWAGVPFYLRHGKAMAETNHLVALDLREPPMRMFPDSTQHHGANQLVFDFGEPGAIVADFQAKVPGAEMKLGPARMTFRYEESFCAENQLEAYERLIHDALLGDATLFTRAAGIERLWEISDPLLEDPPPVISYPRGSWGPEEADELIEPGEWRLPESGATDEAAGE
ncbi:MAG: glucose-6-phosphate dehydrogenase [Solirubrobacterales bacterium]